MQLLILVLLSTISFLPSKVPYYFILDDELNSLFKLAKHLKMKGLENNIATFLAAKVYIKLNLDDYNKKKNELGIK